MTPLGRSSAGCSTATTPSAPYGPNPGQILRATHHPAGGAAPSTIQLRVAPAATGATLAIHHERLPDTEARETMGRHWADELEPLIADA